MLDIEKYKKQIEDFRQHLLTIGSETTTDDELDYYYDKTQFSIAHDNHNVSILFDAVSYNAILDAIEQILEEL